MANTKKSRLIAASIAGLIAAGSSMALTGLANAEGPMGAGVACYGVNACKGMGDCGGKGNACSGKNACKGTSFVQVDNEETCKQIGGKTTAS